MNSRERLLAVLNREPFDRFPIDIWHVPEIYEDLATHLGTRDIVEIYRKLGIDKMGWVGVPYTGDLRPAEGEDEIVTLWGARLKPQQAGDAAYSEMAENPLADMEEVEEVEEFPWWPDPDKFDIDFAEKQVEDFGKDFVTLGPWVSFFEIYCQMRGLEEAMVDTVAEPEFLNAALDRIEDVQTRMLRQLLDRVGSKLDLVFISDDMGSQNNLLFSLDTWHEFIGPRLRRWCEMIHSYGVRVFYHSDGAVDALIPHLIDAGIDVLNPIQHKCPGMGLESLKAKYGDKIIFHGGVDTQDVMPFGTADDVRAETQRCIDILGAGGGYIPCSCHNIQAGTPIENILAMIETAHKSVPVGV